MLYVCAWRIWQIHNIKIYLFNASFESNYSSIIHHSAHNVFITVILVIRAWMNSLMQQHSVKKNNQGHSITSS